MIFSYKYIFQENIPLGDNPHFHDTQIFMATDFHPLTGVLDPTPQICHILRVSLSP